MNVSECHGHIFMDGTDYKQAMKQHKDGVQRELIRQRLSALQNSGIRYYRDGGDKLGVSAYAREVASEYGIEYRTCIFGTHKKGNYGGIVGFAFSDASEFRLLLRKAETERADFIKLMASGIMDFQTAGGISAGALSAAELKELIHMAHDSGFAVMSHVNGNDNVKAAAEAGVDSIEHGYFISEDCVRIMRDANCVWVPTLAATAAFAGRSGFAAGVAEENLLLQGKMLRYAQSIGVWIASGSDAGAVGVSPSRGIYAEQGLLAAAGVETACFLKGNGEIQRRFKREV